MRVPVHRVALETCGVCDGERYLGAKRLVPLLERLHREIEAMESTASIDRTRNFDVRRLDALVEARRGLGTVVGIDAAALRDLLVTDATARLAEWMIRSDATDERRIAFVSDPMRSGRRDGVLRFGSNRVRVASVLWPTDAAPSLGVGDSSSSSDSDGEQEREPSDGAPSSKGSATGGRASGGAGARHFVVGRLGPIEHDERGPIVVLEAAAIVPAP